MMTREERLSLAGNSFHTEGYAVLRDARRAGPDRERWPRISPNEAKEIADDLHRANELVAALRALAASTPTPESI